MKIAICVGQLNMGGVGTSTMILADGLTQAGDIADIVVTDFRTGSSYESLLRKGRSVKVISAGERWLRKRLLKTLEYLSTYDVVINNHSLETKLILPALPTSIVKISVIRSTNKEVIFEAKSYSLFVDSLVGISPEVSRLLSLASVQTRIDCIPNSVVNITMKPTYLSFPLRLIYLGRLSDIDKNILLLPDILAECLKYYPDLTLYIVGDGQDCQLLRQKFCEMGLMEAVKFIGEVSREQVGQYFANMHFALFPSNYEGFGLSLVESMAAGCVPIASDIPSFRWILSRYSDFLLCPVSDSDAYAERILSISRDSAVYNEIQKQLKIIQIERFSVPIMIDAYQSLIKNIIETPKNNSDREIPFEQIPLSPRQHFLVSRGWYLLWKVKCIFKRIILIPGRLV